MYMDFYYGYSVTVCSAANHRSAESERRAIFLFSQSDVIDEFSTSDHEWAAVLSSL